jgi:hypothetical protein
MNLRACTSETHMIKRSEAMEGVRVVGKKRKDPWMRRCPLVAECLFKESQSSVCDIIHSRLQPRHLISIRS